MAPHQSATNLIGCLPSLKLRQTTFAVRRLACQPKRHWPRRLVGLGRFELPTSRLSSARSNQLSYKPEPGVSGQKPAIRNKSDYRILMTDSWSARSRRKRNEDGGVPPMDLTGLMRSVLMFPRDPIEPREASLKDHP